MSFCFCKWKSKAFANAWHFLNYHLGFQTGLVFWNPQITLFLCTKNTSSVSWTSVAELMTGALVNSTDGFVFSSMFSSLSSTPPKNKSATALWVNHGGHHWPSSLLAASCPDPLRKEDDYPCSPSSTRRQVTGLVLRASVQFVSLE